MNKLTVLIAVCITTSFATNAQCDSTIKWKSSKTEFIDTSGNIKRANDETVEVTLSKTKITIAPPGSAEETMTGDVTDYACDWADKQNGKTSLKAIVVDGRGDTRHIAITIEARNGKTTLLLRAQEEPDVIRLTIDSFEEVK